MKQFSIVEHFDSAHSGSFVKVRHQKTGDFYLMMKLKLENSQKDAESIQSQIKTIQQINHPSIVRYFKAYLDEDEMAVLMDYPAEGNLRSYIERHLSGIPQYDVVDFFRQIVSGIEASHTAKVQHQALSPDNIFLSKSGQIKITDFKLLENFPSRFPLDLTADKTMYVAPEFLSGSKIDPFQCDIWNLGLILYELMTLKAPFPSSPVITEDETVSRASYPPIQGEYDQELAKLVDSMLVLDPLARISIRELKERIPQVEKSQMRCCEEEKIIILAKMGNNRVIKKQ